MSAKYKKKSHDFIVDFLAMTTENLTCDVISPVDFMKSTVVFYLAEMGEGLQVHVDEKQKNSVSPLKLAELQKEVLQKLIHMTNDHIQGIYDDKNESKTDGNGCM